MRAKSVDLKTWSSNLLDLGGTSKLKFHTALLMSSTISRNCIPKYKCFRKSPAWRVTEFDPKIWKNGREMQSMDINIYVSGGKNCND